MSCKKLVCTFAFILLAVAQPAASTCPDQTADSLLTFTGKVDYANLLSGFGEVGAALELIDKGYGDQKLDDCGHRLKARLLAELGNYARADSVLALVLPESDPGGKNLHYLRRAKLNYLAGNPRKALSLLSAIDSVPDDAFDAYRDLLTVQAFHALGRVDEAAELGENVLGSGRIPPSLRVEFENVLVDVYVSLQRNEEASDLLTSLARRVKNPAERLKLLSRLYEVQVRTGQTKAARTTAVRIVSSYGRFKQAASVADDFLSRFEPAGLSNYELVAFAQFLIDQSAFKKAALLLGTLDRRELGPTAREELRIAWARYYYLTGRYERAADLAKTSFGIPSIKRQSILLMARSCRKTGDAVRAARLYEYFAREMPNDSKAAEALYVASKLYESKGWPSQARTLLDRLMTSYPTSYFGRLAVLNRAKRLIEGGDYESSRKILESALRRSKHTDESAMFYLGRIYSKTEDRARNDKIINDILTLNPNSFYLFPGVKTDFRRPHTTSTGQVALEGNDGLLQFLKSAVERRASAYRGISRALTGAGRQNWNFTRDVLPYVERGVWCLESGFREWGERELEYAYSRCSDSPRALLELGLIYDRYAMTWRSVRAYQRVKDSVNWKTRRELNSEFLTLMYPTPYPVQVLENSSYYDLPPHLVYAMIREESRFDFNAVSRVGALGLMQLMPETGKHVARELEMPEWGDESLLTPEINLAFGIWYASSLLGRSGGDPVRMLAAYNAGPSNAKRWFEGKKDKDQVIDAVDGIDFQETRSYVKRVVESSNVYFSLYFDPGPPDSRVSR